MNMTMNMKQDATRRQDTTPSDRMDDEMLRQMLGVQEDGGATSGERQGMPNCRGEYGVQPIPTMPQHPACENGCGGGGAFGIAGGTLAALYVPLQDFDELYEEEMALTRGTLFRKLDLPFHGGKGCK